MQTKNREEREHENKTQYQLLYAGVTLVALSTGLMISAQSAQAATGTAEPATTTVKDSEGATSGEVAASAKIADDTMNDTSGENTSPSSVTSQASSAAPSSVTSQASSTASGKPAAAQQPYQLSSLIGTSHATSGKETVEKPTEPVQTSVTTTTSLKIKVSSMAVKNSRMLPAMGESLRLNQVRPSSRLLTRAVAVPTSADTTTPDADGFSYALNSEGYGYIITAYSGTSKNVVIPDTHTGSAGSFNVTEIADGVFQNDGIKSLTMGANIQIIGEAAFENNLLTTVDFSRNNGSLWDIKANAFTGNKLAGVLTLPPTVTQIGSAAFEGSELGDGSGNQLSGIDFGKGTVPVQISDKAFAYNALTSVILPKKTLSVGKSAFAYNDLTTVDLGDALQTIDIAAFLSNKITAVSIPETVTTIGSNAFQYNQIVQLNLNNADGLTTIGESAFDNNLLTNVVIPDNVKTIGTAAFSTNSTLTQLTLGKSVQSIGDAAFAGDGISGELYIPNTVITIGDTAFAGNQLTGLKLGDGASKLETIGSAAFTGNKTLAGTLVIPDSVSFINSGAFAGDSLNAIDFGKSTGTIGESAFSGNKLTGTLILSDGIQHIGTATFAGNQLTGLKLGTDLLTIGSSAFAKNQLMGMLEVPNSVTNIGDSAFASNNLGGLQLDGTVNSVGIDAFDGNNLQKIQAVQPVKNLGDYAFDGQKTLAVTVSRSGNQLTGIRAAITKQLQLQNFSLTDPMVFKLDGAMVTYDPTTDSLTLPANFTATSLTFSLSSGTTEDATDHSGNYGVDALTLSWSTSDSGSGTTTPTTPTKPTTPSTPSTPTIPSKPTKKTKPAKTSQKKTPARNAEQRRSKGVDVKRKGQHAAVRFAGSPAFNGTQQGTMTASWSYAQQAAIVKRSSTANSQKRPQTHLPQTNERTTYWSAIGAALLAVLSVFGLGGRRRRN